MAAKYKSCAAAGCNKNAHYTARGARGFCSAHYTRLVRFGDAEAKVQKQGQARDFFERVVMGHSGEDCLFWPFSRDNNGYAALWEDGAARKVSRLVCARIHGDPDSENMHAAHSCGNGHMGCVNPKHLRWATPAENASDKIEHGTANRGERHVWSKLSEDDVREIRSLGVINTATEIAKIFGMSRTAVRLILERKTWAWLD